MIELVVQKSVYQHKAIAKKPKPHDLYADQGAMWNATMLGEKLLRRLLGWLRTQHGRKQRNKLKQPLRA